MMLKRSRNVLRRRRNGEDIKLSGNPSVIEAKLREYGFQQIKRKTGGYTALCKFHQEKNPSFSINDAGLWMCWSCGVKGNLTQLVKKLGGDMDWREAQKLLGVELRPREPKKKKAMANLPDGFSAYALQQEVPRPIIKRLEWPTIQKFRLGSAPGKDFKSRCLIPITFRGNVVGYHGRDTSGKAFLKYVNPTDWEIKDYLFNFDGCQNGAPLIIVEGAFSCMSMVEKGFTNTVATFGGKFTQKQVRRIFELNPDEVIICYDRDPSKIKDGREDGLAGQKAAMKLGDILNDLLTTTIMALPYEQDPNDISKDILTNCYRRRVDFSALARRRNGNSNGTTATGRGDRRDSMVKAI